MKDYDMLYICVRTYGNGKFMNRVHNTYFEYLSQAERAVEELNTTDVGCCEPCGDRWIIMPVAKYLGPVWKVKGEK